MATYTNYRLPVPEARRLASLESIRHDLNGVIEYCDRLEQLKSQGSDFTLWEALCAAMVVRYARCFSPGARDWLAHDLLDGASAAQRDLHTYVIAVRSKHVAHSVNGFEETDVTVMVREDDNTIHSVSAAHGRVVGLSFEKPLLIRELAQWVLNHVAGQIDVERPSLLAIAHRVGVEKIKSFGSPVLGGTTMDGDAARPRSKP